MSDAEIRLYHSEITARIQPYTVKIRIAVSIDLGIFKSKMEKKSHAFYFPYQLVQKF
jgi:hypothetical protein